MIEERDISVAMRDGTRLAVDVYRPDAPGKYPVLYAAASPVVGIISLGLASGTEIDMIGFLTPDISE